VEDNLKQRTDHPTLRLAYDHLACLWTILSYSTSRSMRLTLPLNLYDLIFNPNISEAWMMLDSHQGLTGLFNWTGASSKAAVLLTISPSHLVCLSPNGGLLLR
jgi:hypothetical protein